MVVEDGVWSFGLSVRGLRLLSFKSLPSDLEWLFIGPKDKSMEVLMVSDTET